MPGSPAMINKLMLPVRLSKLPPHVYQCLMKMAYINKSLQSGDILNYYLATNVNNLCRICLEKGTKLMHIFDPIKPPHFSVLIMACAAVQVIEGDGLPPYICQKCISKLNIAFQFKTLCESSDTKLRQCFDKCSQESNLTGFTVSKKYSNKCFKNNEADSQKYIVPSEMAEIDNIVDVPLQIQESLSHSIDGDTSDLQLFQKNDIKLKFNINDMTSHGFSLKVEDSLLNNPNIAHPVRFKHTSKHHQCDTCGKIFRTKPGLVHHIRIHTGERPYICHLCEKRFTNGGHLHTHMRTHTGEKNHICAACGKAFATAQQLTKHTIAIHTSERPYGCTYCSKRFASSSNLNTHTKIHTGEKNYRCDQCGKAFSTKGQLYQHMLVHSGEKAYLCEYCNKRFSQKAHLVRHQRTHRN